MPNPRKSTDHLSKSTLKQNPGRYAGRSQEPVLTSPLGASPAHLSAEQKKIWADLVKRVAKGVLFSCDINIVELTTRLTEKMRSGEMTATEISQYRGCLASLGVTPADRTRVKAPKEQPKKSALDSLLDGDDDSPHVN